MAPKGTAKRPLGDVLGLAAVYPARTVLPLGRAILLLLVLASAGLAWRMLRRGAGPVAYWIVGWAAAGLAGALALAQRELPFLALLAHALGACFAGLLLAGALSFAGRRVPDWLLPAVLAWGCLRAGVAAAGLEPLAYGLAFVWEPWAALAAAWIVWRSTRDARSTRAERWLGPALAVLAVVGGLHVAWLASGRLSQQLVALWVVFAPPVLGLQIQASADRFGRRISHTLRARVAERTAALLASEERYRAVSELNADTSFRVRIDRELRLIPEWAAGGLAAIAGPEAEAMGGHGWLALLPDQERNKMRDRLAELQVGNRFDDERSIVAPDGQTRWLALRLMVAAREPDGTIDLIGSARDVTERHCAEQRQRQLEAHIEQIQRLESLGVLAGGIAHDFNNLLTVIRGHARLALAELPPGAPLRARLERIGEAAGHAGALTGQMLTYAGKAAPALGPLDLREVVGSLGELLRASLPEGCAFETACAPDLPAVEGDAGQLGQVVLNLVLNAADALGGRPGHVSLRVEGAELGETELAGALGHRELEPGRYVVLEVRDDGCGMDAETAARVCEPFFTTRFSGRGLGMAAVLGIVRAHRGALVIESAPGRGTTVRVVLPASERPAAEAVAASAPPAPVRDTLHARVLVVDDDPAVRELGAEMLARAGFEVIAAEGGAAAVALVEGGERVDAVLLDLTMPDLGGEPTFLRLRAIRPDLPVVLVSGFDAEQASQRFAARGLDGFLRKPFEPEEVVAAVIAALQSHKGDQSS